MNKLCEKLEEQANEGKSVNILNAYKSFLLDGISSFCFGTSLNALEAPDFNGPVGLAMHEAMSAVPTLRHFRILKLLEARVPASFITTLQPKIKGLIDMREVRDARVWYRVFANPIMFFRHLHCKYDKYSTILKSCVARRTLRYFTSFSMRSMVIKFLISSGSKVKLF